MKNLFKILLCGVVLTAFVACNDDPSTDSTPAGSNGLLSKDCDDRVEISGDEQNFTISFETSGSWTAKLSNTAFASLQDDNKSGDAGENTIVVSFKQNTSDASRIVTLSLTVGGSQKAITLCRFTQRSMGQKGTDAAVNMQITWPWLDKMYLWNEELRSNVVPDFNQAYDDFLENTIERLYSVNLASPINSKDGYWYPSRDAAEDEREWVFYSYINRTPLASTSSVTRAGKAMVLGFGIWAEPMLFDNTTVCFPVLWVYPDSPAEQAGVKRGDIIYKVNGAKILLANDAWMTPYAELCGNHISQGERSITLYDIDNEADGATYTLRSGSYYETPVVYDAVFKNEAETLKIGYVVYTSFESAYDDDLKAVFDKFKSDNITDIIVDLRYNGGGAVSSARLLCSILGGPQCAGQVFEYYRYNDERMKGGGYNMNDYTSWKSEAFMEDIANSYGFNFDKIYIIGTYSTASASELTINALRGIGKDVVLVGDPTNGKDVGMEVTSPILDGYQYSLAAITFQSYNCKGESDYDNGFIPNLNVADITTNRRPLDYFLPMQWGIDDEGNMENGLYIAINYGIAKDSPSASVPKRMSATRSVKPEGMKKLAIPAKMRDYRRMNMYMDYQEPEEK